MHLNRGCHVAIQVAPGPQNWSPNMLIFQKMVEAVDNPAAEHPLPIIVDFHGAGKEVLDWIHIVGAISHRYGVPMVLNEE